MKIVNQKEVPLLCGKCTNLFNSREWLSVISKTYNIAFKSVIDINNNFVLPYSEITDDFFDSVKSIPFSDYTLFESNEKLITEALQYLLDRYPNRYIETSVVAQKAPQVDNFTATKYGYLIQVDIKKWKESRDWKEAYERNIRNALNYGLSVRINRNYDGITGFYLLHENLRINKFKKLPQPFRFFNNIYNEFIVKENGFIMEAWNRDILIASWFILVHNDVLYYKFGASHPDYLHLRPNDLLFRSLMQYGSDNHFKTIDLGFSGATKSYEGLIRFKKKEGGTQIPIYRIDRYPENFDRTIIKKRAEYLSRITKNALETGKISAIREASELYYGRFA